MHAKNPRPLEARDLIPGAFTIDGVLTIDECAALIAMAERAGFSDAPVTTARGPVMMPDLRDNSRAMIDDPDCAQALWARIAPCFKPRGRWRPVGLNERLRFYRYDPGQRFAPHRDGHVARSADERSFVTLLVYLNGDCQGGHTRLIGADVAPRAGAALCFDHELLHEGAPVTSGRKLVLRSDVMFRRAPTTLIHLDSLNF